MRDAISGLIGRYDQLGRYFDRPAIDSINAVSYTHLTLPTNSSV